MWLAGDMVLSTKETGDPRFEFHGKVGEMALETSTGDPRRNVDWARLGGILGITWIVLFLLGAFILQGDTPSRDDSIADIREYFVDDGGRYLLGDYLLGIAFTLFFLPFVVILRRVLAARGGWPDLLARVSLYAGVIAVVWGGIAGFFWGALALGADNPEVDDSSVRTLMELDAYAFSGLLLPIGLFMGAAGLSIWLSGALWRWLGIIGIIGFLGSYIGAAWPADGDEEGALAAVGIVGFVGIMIFVLITSINLLMKRDDSRSRPSRDDGIHAEER